MPDWDYIRQKLITRREEIGLAQRDLAERMNSHQSWISQLESGKVGNPRITTVIAWARALDADLDLILELP